MEKFLKDIYTFFTFLEFRECILRFFIQILDSVSSTYNNSQVVNSGEGLPKWPSGEESARQCRRCKDVGQSLHQEDPLE